MGSNTRKAGIRIIDTVEWGSYISHLFSTKEEYYKIVIPYIQAGLKDEELCIWIYSDNTSYEDIVSILNKSIKDVDKYIAKGQFIIRHYGEWYLKDGTFNHKRDSGQWKKLTQWALNNGFVGLRIAVDLTWAIGKYLEDILVYKSEFDEIMNGLPFVAMSFYDVNSLDALQTVGIINGNNYTIVKQNDSFKVINNVEQPKKDNKFALTEQACREMLEILPISIFIYNDKKILYCNKQALNLIGYENFNQKRDTLSLLDFVSDRNGLYKHINEIISGGNYTHYSLYELYSSYGKGKLVEMASKKYYYEGQPAVLSLVRVLTPSSEINKLQLSLSKRSQLFTHPFEEKYKTNFFATISHELRTPLNIILGTLQLLEIETNTRKDKFKEKKYIKIMKKNSLRLLRLINNIIDLLRLDFNCYEIRKQNCNIVKIIEDTVLATVEHAKEKDISITFDTDIEEKIMACDPIQIERIMLNLLSNAIKYTPRKGKVLVGIRDKIDKIEIFVKDNGIGISKEKQKIIFDKFEQADKSLTRPYEGSGIGLSIVKALVEKHNGSISVNSQLGKGSEFIIQLPCELIEDLDSHLNSIQNNYIYNCYNGIKSINVELSGLY